MSRGLVCEFIAAEKTSYGVRRLCRVFRTSPTSFYAWAARAGGPTAAELADALGVSAERVLEARALETAMHPVSLDRPVGTDSGEDAESTLIDHLGEPDAGYARTEDALAVESLLRRLPERERTIVRLRFGEELTQTQIAARVGISQMYVSRLLSRSLAELGEMAAAEEAA